MRGSLRLLSLWLICLAPIAQAQPTAQTPTGSETSTDVASHATDAAPPSATPETSTDAAADASTDAGVAEPTTPPVPASAPEPAPAESLDDDDDDDQPFDEQLAPEDTGDETDATTTIRYFLERIRVRGNSKTAAAVIKRYIPLTRGDVLDVDDPTIETIRFRLMGTGWFDDVLLSLERGTRRGWIVLVVDVRERNTIVLQSVAMGLSRVVGSHESSVKDSLEPYAGLGLAETNLFGLGSTLAAQAVVASSQYGLALSYRDPMLLGRGYELSSHVFHNRALEFFGKEGANFVSIGCPLTPAEIAAGEECPPPVLAKAAVVIYRRSGVSIGTGHDITGTLRYTLDWQGELVTVLNKPDAASRQRGDATLPIDFRIDDGTSIVSSLQLGLIYDRRDDPGLTHRGHFAHFRSIAASGLLGSRYDFTRLEVSARHWQPLPWGHVLSFGVFAGAVFGRAPFFYHFYASDLSDLIPSRVLDLNLDHRSPHNLLGTSIGEMRSEELAGRLDVEYALPLIRRGQAIRVLDAYLRVGTYMLANREDVRVAIPGYEGAARIPIDLTFDAGLRADTSLGVFSFGLSTLFGFLPYF